jgi:hypothetical protein
MLYIGLAAGCYVYQNPARGHIFWHFGSAYALFVWWYMYRSLPIYLSISYAYLTNAVFVS